MTPAEQLRLRTAIDQALAVAKPERSIELGLMFQCLTLRDSPENAPAEFRELLAVLAGIASLEIFNHAEQRSFTPRLQVNLLFLMQWLLGRAQLVGSEDAVQGLVQYLATESIELTEMLWVGGVTTAVTHRWRNLELLPFDAAPMTDAKWQIATQVFGATRLPTIAIRRRHVVPRLHLRPWDNPPMWERIDFESLMDVLRASTAVKSAGWQIKFHTVEGPDWAPWKMDFQQFGVDYSRIAHPKAVEAVDWPRIETCLNAFADHGDRAVFRLPADRLSRSVLQGIDLVNASIEWGIAIESLYGPVSQNAKILPTIRGAARQLLGTSARRKREIGNLLTKAYDLRSRAVHAGRFDADEEGRENWSDHSVAMDTIQNAQQLAANTLERLIATGRPKWMNEQAAQLRWPDLISRYFRRRTGKDPSPA